MELHFRNQILDESLNGVQDLQRIVNNTSRRKLVSMARWGEQAKQENIAWHVESMFLIGIKR